MGGFQGFDKYISFILKLVDIVLVSLVESFNFLPTFVHNQHKVYFQYKSPRIIFLINMSKYLILIKVLSCF